MVELVPKIRRLSILFSARVHVKFSIIGRPRLLILSITRPRPCLKSRCPYNSVGRIINRESSCEKFISEISRTTFFFAIVQGTRKRNDRIESNENETSNLRGRLTKTEQECNEWRSGERAIFITGGGGETSLWSWLLHRSFRFMPLPLRRWNPDKR